MEATHRAPASYFSGGGDVADCPGRVNPNNSPSSSKRVSLEDF